MAEHKNERLQQLVEQVARLQAEHVEQQTKVEQQQEEIAALRGELKRLCSAGTGEARRGSRVHERTGASSRRSLLKWGGATAAATAVAMAAGEQAAHAQPRIDGSGISAGNETTAEHATTLKFDGTSGNAKVLFLAHDTTFHASGAQYPAALGGWVDGATSGNTTGIYGYSGATSGYGIVGVSNNIGVLGSGANGVGVQGQSTSGVDLAAAGAGRLLQSLQGSTGAPSSGGYNAGEQIRDSNGDLYICVASGSPGRWKKVTAIPATATGGASVLFPVPFRIFDTRPGVGELGGLGPMTPGQIITLQVTGTIDAHDTSVFVPSGASGIIGDLIAISPSGSGFLGIQPSTGSHDPYAWVNYTSGVTIHNSVVVALSASGQVDIECSLANSGAGLTITGYII